MRSLRRNDREWNVVGESESHQWHVVHTKPPLYLQCRRLSRYAFVYLKITVRRNPWRLEVGVDVIVHLCVHMLCVKEIHVGAVYFV